MQQDTTFLKSCKKHEMFGKTGLYVWNFHGCSTDKRDDNKQVVTQLTVKVTEALCHLVDECITQLATSALHSPQFDDY